ncbi:MAG TPA: RNA polymerase sigma factor [Ktedonobacteraceae bacterium]
MVLDTRGDNEELALIHRASNGDHEAFRLLVLSYEAQLLAYLIHMLGDRDSAYDVVQDTFVAVYYALPRWRPLSFNDAASTTSSPIHKQLLAPWLYRIATNKAISLLRKNSFYVRGPVQQDNEYRWQELLRNQSPSSRERVASPEERYIARELLIQALQQLAEEDAACLILHVVSGERYKEIALQLGMTSEAVRKRIARALVTLRKIYVQLETEIHS